MRHGRRGRDLGNIPWVPIAAVVGVIAVVIIAVMFFLGGGSVSAAGGSPSPGSSSAAPQTTLLSNKGVASITVKETPAPTIPVSGVWISVDYMGGYKGTYGMPSDPQKVEDSGARLYEVVNAAGTVQANLSKKDSSTKHALTVSIYKDGQLLNSGTTSDSYGKVSITANVGGSTAQTTSATVNPTKTAVTATVKTTTAVTVKTTTKSS
jgi:hypothetical protein